MGVAARWKKDIERMREQAAAGIGIVDTPASHVPLVGAARIALVGYAASFRFTPFDDPTLAIWAMNDHMRVLPRVDALFELHDDDVVKAEGHWDELKSLPYPIVMQQHFDDVPMSVAYPLEDVARRYTLAGRIKPALTSSAALMLALAVDVQPRPREIGLYGLDMERDSEFDGQREAAAFWLGVAHARGIRVCLQPSSDILSVDFIYAYEETARALRLEKLRERRMYLRAHLARARDVARQIEHDRPTLTGADVELAPIRLREAEMAAERFEGALAEVDHGLRRCS